MSINILNFDVVIVGAGIAGAALACALGNSDLKVAVVEAQSLSTQWPEQKYTLAGFDPRVSALSPSSQRFLSHLGVWSRISERRLSAYHAMHVWDAEGTGSIDFAAQEINQLELGHIVENRMTVAALLSRIRELANIQLIDLACVSSINTLESYQDSQCHQLQLADGRQLHSPLIIAADGANSQIRSQANFSTREWDYRHHALVVTVQTSKPHQNIAWQRFMPEGPLAFLPLQTDSADKHFCSIVWSTVPQDAENLMALNEREFAQALAKAFEFRLGNILDIGRRLSFPLRQRHAHDYIKPGIALVGDAAHTVHPLAGQGINLGLKDVQVLAQEILRAQQRGLDTASSQILLRYQRRRKGDNLTMMIAMESFKRVFEQPALPVRWLRNTGMRWLNSSRWLKHRVMREAMGL